MPEPLPIRPAARERLEAMTAYLKALAPEGFSMNDTGLRAPHGWIDLQPRDVLRMTPDETPACMMGHIPHIAREWTHEQIRLARQRCFELGWSGLVSAFTGYDLRELDYHRTGNANATWAWLFHRAWSAVDDTTNAAIERIRRALDEGVPGPFVALELRDPARYAVLAAA